MTRILSLAFVLLFSFGGAHAQGGLLDTLGKSLGLSNNQGNPVFLEPDQAFVFTAQAIDRNTVRLHWDVTEGYYLYRDKIEVSLPDTFAVSIASLDKPKGEMKHDESFGDMAVYHNNVDVTARLVAKQGMPDKVTLSVVYQGCADAGLCYPPITKTVTLNLPAATSPITATPATSATTTTVAPEGNTLAKNAAAVTAGNEQDQLADMLSNRSTLAVIATFFGLGILLAFTPCVFPMIPILSSIIVGQGSQLTGRRGFVLSLTYVLAMALTYTVAGVFAGLFGENLQVMFQNPWILGSFSIVFVALALSMFGFYELQLPAGLQSRLSELSNRQQGGTLIGVAIMGLLSALIVGPCLAPPLAGALIYIGQTGDAILGGIALFALSMGMGAPLLLIGASAGRYLPKAGRWMETVKAVFGVLLLGVAIWMLERILPIQITLLMWAALLITSSIYMGALEPLGDAVGGWQKLWKGLGLVTLLYGTLLLIGTFSGAKDMLEPLAGLQISAAPSQQTSETPFTRIKTVADLENALDQARTLGKPVMLDFYADWCVACKEMEHKTFTDPGVRQRLNDFVLLQADVTANDEADKALLQHFKILGPPSIMFFDRNGNERKDQRVVGFMSPQPFLAQLQRAAQ